MSPRDRTTRIGAHIHTTLHINMVGWVGDAPAELQLVLYSDADFASDLTDRKSISGCLIFLMVCWYIGFAPSNPMCRYLPWKANL